MKRFIALSMLLLAMAMSTQMVSGQSVSITLNPGWTWIGHPGSDTLTIANALGSFVPKEGDMIKSMYAYSTFTNGCWVGDVSHLYPAYGYMYFSQRSVPVVLSFGETSSSSVTVATLEPTNITAISAVSGGEVTTSDGTYIIVKGLCWAAHENPTTNDDFYQEAESGVGGFTISMTDLGINTTYYVRAYAVTPNGTVYGGQKSFTTRDGIPTLVTAEVTSIGSRWASSGGNVTDDGGLNITARGVCWSTSPNPTIADSHTNDGTGTGSFSSYATGLNPGSVYYLRSYATTTAGTGYGEQKTFTTLENDFVDLGLPSGLLWSTFNVGAEYPEAYGNYFAWGETQPKNTYNWSTYQYCNGSWNTLTKYCNNSEYGYNGFTDNLTNLLPEDDAATANWGSNWRMPTKQEWQELLDNTTNIWLTQNGVSGRLFTASNGNAIFIPATGCWLGSNHWGCWGDYYWSSSLCMIEPWSWHVEFNSNYCFLTWEAPNAGSRSDGLSIRPVRCKNSVVNVTANPAEGGTLSGGGTYMDRSSCTVVATANENYMFVNWTEDGEVVSTEATFSFVVSGNRNLVANFTPSVSGHAYVDLGLPSGLLWATMNVGANTPEGEGDYFAWGETQPKNTYDWSTYQYCNGSANTLTKYCDNPEYGYNGFTDNLTTLLPEDDAATVNWGADWRMPTLAEWNELINNTTRTRITRNGVDGFLFAATNGNNLFLPDWHMFWSSVIAKNQPDYAGCCYLETVEHEDELGFIIDIDLDIFTEYCGEYRYWRGSVRPVCCKNSVVNVTANPAEGGTVSGGGTYMDHTSCTITATPNEDYIFLCWTEDGKMVSTQATYTFMVSGNRDLVANFNFNNAINAPIGAIAGLFSVGEGRQVYFSKGNLQYQSSTNTWRFAESQYNTCDLGEMQYYVWVGDDEDGYWANVSMDDYYACIEQECFDYYTECDVSTQYGASNSAWIDLFGWGTSGYHNSGDPYNVYYQPWSTSTATVNKNYNWYGYGPSTIMASPNLTGSSANYDWGVYNPISNGGNLPNQWRTLTEQEWTYVFYNRTTISGIRYAKANVNNVNGVILLPDYWNSSSYNLNSPNTSDASFDSNILTASQWAMLENDGAVFLPAGGTRLGTSVRSFGSLCDYWSASYDNSSCAYRLWVNPYGILIYSANWLVGRFCGRSVRLVHDSE